MEAQRHGRWVLVRLHGDVDMANASVLETQALGLLDNADEALTVDLTDVDYIDSAGIRVLASLRRLLEQRQQRLSLIVPEDSVLTKALTVGGIVRVITTYDSEEAARAGHLGDEPRSSG